MSKCCFKCAETKLLEEFMKGRGCCKDCHNKQRREKYSTNEEVRQRCIQQSTELKARKARERRDELQRKQTEIGEDNKVCRSCQVIQLKTNFRHNRCICGDCERKNGREFRQSEKGKEKTMNWKINNPGRINEWCKLRLKTDPVFKFIATQRSRIRTALETKQKRTIEYLGCNAELFFQWLDYQFNKNNDFTFENHGTVWHIDHVIPISRFNMADEADQLLAFNWRNTMPLSIHENLSKHNKIVSTQNEQHLQNLIQYHAEYNIELPQEFIDLYATRPNCSGSPLEL